MKATDQFHIGIVVDDVASTLRELSALFGYAWCDELGGPATVRLPAGETVLDLRSTYSMTSPRLEVVRGIPGTVWTPSSSGIHHLGYWSDDVAADSAELAGQGFAVEAVGARPDGTPYWAFHSSPTGPRIELVTRLLQPTLEQYWATGRRPS